MNTNPPNTPPLPGVSAEVSGFGALDARSKENLAAIAKQFGVTDADTLEKRELIVRILQADAANAGLLYREGTLEIMPDGFGFLRFPQNNYYPCPEDIYLSASQIQRFGLQSGDTVSGQVRPPREKERFYGMVKVESVGGQAAEKALTRKKFDELTACFPNQRFMLEPGADDLSMRVMDLFTPIGKGQRGLIVAAPRTGKTILLQKIANAITRNTPNAHVIILLIDERPEEVTDMQRTCTAAEVVSSTFDSNAHRHIEMVDIVFEKAKRLVEYGRDVVILLDSLTRLARAYNSVAPKGGKTMSGGMESNALARPKKYFGAARNTEEGGSLTIVATTLVQTGSRADELIFEEFKGTGNMEIWLDRELADRRLFPAINILKSGTRNEEVLYHPDEYPRIVAVRQALAGLLLVEGVQLVLDKLRKTKTNAEFLMTAKF